jgi:hypothetical protein
MSAESNQQAVLGALQAGACEYLIKPLRRNELTTLWQHVWRRKQPHSGAAGAGPRLDASHGQTAPECSGAQSTLADATTDAGLPDRQASCSNASGSGTATALGTARREQSATTGAARALPAAYGGAPAAAAAAAWDRQPASPSSETAGCSDQTGQAERPSFRRSATPEAGGSAARPPAARPADAVAVCPSTDVAAPSGSFMTTACASWATPASGGQEQQSADCSAAAPARNVLADAGMDATAAAALISMSSMLDRQPSAALSSGTLENVQLTIQPLELTMRPLTGTASWQACPSLPGMKELCHM